MPELPEVETVIRALRPKIEGSKIISVNVLFPRLRIPFPKNMHEILTGRHIIDITRRAKYLLFKLSDGLTMLAHLGMTGKFTGIQTKYVSIKHDHIIFYLSESILIYNDSRRFGLIDLIETDKLFNHKLLCNLGVEPLEQDFTAEYLAQKLKNRQVPIKNAIMDSKIVVGVGNIYASEALFIAKIPPSKKANLLSINEYRNLVNAIKKVLQDAIASGGSSIRDFVSIDNNKGYFQHNFAVYGKSKKPCTYCSTSIVKIYQGGRSTFFCPTCQN